MPIVQLQPEQQIQGRADWKAYQQAQAIFVKQRHPDSYGIQFLTHVLFGFGALDQDYLAYPRAANAWHLLRQGVQIRPLWITAQEQFRNSGVWHGKANSHYLTPSLLLTSGLQEQISPRLRQQILALNPTATWINWLGLLDQQTRSCQDLQASELVLGPQSLPKTFSWQLPLQRLQQLQQILPTSASITYGQLLAQIDPRLAQAYQAVAAGAVKGTASTPICLNAVVPATNQELLAQKQSLQNLSAQVEHALKNSLQALLDLPDTTNYQQLYQVLQSVASFFPEQGTKVLQNIASSESLLGFLRYCLQEVRDQELLKLLAVVPVDWSSLYSQTPLSFSTLTSSATGTYFDPFPHVLIRQHFHDEQHLLFLLQTFQSHFDIKAQNQDREYPLDLAIEHKLEQVFAHLVYRGSAQVSERRWRQAVAFGHKMQQEQTKRAFHLLKQRDAHLRWRMALSYILPQNDAGEVRTANLGTRTLATTARRQLFDASGALGRLEK